jgi:hypothetical protein
MAVNAYGRVCRSPAYRIPAALSAACPYLHTAGIRRARKLPPAKKGYTTCRRQKRAGGCGCFHRRRLVIRVFLYACMLLLATDAAHAEGSCVDSMHAPLNGMTCGPAGESLGAGKPFRPSFLPLGLPLLD